MSEQVSSDHEILILGATDVEAALTGREERVIDAVGRAYETHTRHESSLPHSSFVRFPDSDEDRIIALPGYIGGDFGVAGIKWIASVPKNVKLGMERASAAMILNRRETGRPLAILEGSIISKQRTAASAALGAKVLRRGVAPESIGFVGCGPINTEIAHFLSSVWPEVDRFQAFDLDAGRAASFGERLLAERDGGRFEVAETIEALLSSHSLVAFATTAIKPHLADLSICPENATLLHISLRDLTAEAILPHYNVVDDFGHVNRANTSIHLASEAGNEDFVHGSIGELLLGDVEVPPDDGKLRIYSPFGLGALDLAVAQLVYEVSRESGAGTRIEGFLP